MNTMQPKPNGKVTNGHNGASQWGFGHVPAPRPETNALGLGTIDIPPYPGTNPAGSWNTSYMPPPTTLSYGAYGEAAAAPHPAHVVTGEMDSPILQLAQRSADGTFFEVPLTDFDNLPARSNPEFLLSKGLI